MSKSDTSSATVADHESSLAVPFESDSELSRIERAVEASEFEDVEALVREGALQLAAEVLDERLECPRDDCEETFKTERQKRGHLGSEAHALDVPEGEFWCGYCGYGPASWRQLNAHHGASPSHDGDVIRLDEEPDDEDLAIDPADLPDHKNPRLLERLYREYDGNITELCRAHDFDVHQGTVRSWLIKFEIHAVTPQGTDGENVPEYRDRERLERLYREYDGNISEMHRQMEIDVPYRTLQTWLTELDIHDPTARDPSARETNTSEPADVQADEAGADGDDPEGGGREVDQPDEDLLALIEPEDPADVDSFDDLQTPEWLAEASFHVALDMSNTAEEFAKNLGWGDPEDLERMVELLGYEAELAEVDDGD